MNWLATLPSTNALVGTVIVMVLSTTVGVLLGWKPPDGWFTFVISFGTLALVQFTAKRITHRKPGGLPDSDGTAG